MSARLVVCSEAILFLLASPPSASLFLPSENSVTPCIESDGGQARCACARGALGGRCVRLQRLGRVGRDVREGSARGRFDRADEGLRGEVDGDDQLFARAAPKVT